MEVQVQYYSENFFIRCVTVSLLLDDSSIELITRNNNYNKNNNKSQQQTTALKFVFGAAVLTKWVKKVPLQQTQNAQARQWILSPLLH